MNIYRFTFPIDDYYGEEVFEKHVYFVDDGCPTNGQVHSRLRELEKDEARMAESPGMGGPICFEWRQCLEAASLAEEGLPYLPSLTPNLVHASVYINHPRWGRQSISVQKIVLHDVSKSFVSWFDGGKEY
jgi:hypothetical protein